MVFIIKNIWFILFVAWGLPLSYYRSKFRKMVYQTDSWVINIKPVFWKEIKGLFGNIFPDNLNTKSSETSICFTWQFISSYLLRISFSIKTPKKWKI